METICPPQTLAPPFITPELAGIGGELKRSPAHFVVDELPLYEPCGQGEHIYLGLRREGWTTRALQQHLARVFGLREDDVGYAGLKDKQARTTQTFSLRLPLLDPQEALRRAVAELGALTPPVEALWARRHGNKLKSGHLLGNRFRVVVSDPLPGALETAGLVARAIQERGLPNYFGPQRFGKYGDNASQGRQALLGRGPREKWLRRLLLSAWQAELFNDWLARRVREGIFARLIMGDVAKKTDTGGLFTVEAPALEQPRLERGEITYTGPIYGGKMLWAADEAGERERRLLAEQGLAEEALRRAGLSGSRRVARLALEGLSMGLDDQDLAFEFALPKGSYATTVLREFMKIEVQAPEA